MAGEINEVAGGRQHLIAALRHQDPDFRQHRVARPAIDKLDIKLLRTPPRSTRVRVGGGSDCDGLRLIMRRRRS